jgi:hypothetical protein
MTSRHEQRNFLPALILTLVWWSLLFILVFRVDPEVVANFPIRGSYGLFFGLGFLAVWFLTSLLLGNSRRGFLIAFGLVIFGYLRLMGLGSILNLVLIAGILLATEIFVGSKRVDKHPHQSSTLA